MNALKTVVSIVVLLASLFAGAECPNPSAIEREVRSLQESVYPAAAVSELLAHDISVLQSCHIDVNQLKVDQKSVYEILHKAQESCVKESRETLATTESLAQYDLAIKNLFKCSVERGVAASEMKDEVDVFRKKLKAKQALCSPIQVDTKHMGPPRDQGDIGWCYANAAADLLSFHLRQRISALDLVLSYTEKHQSQDPTVEKANVLTSEGGDPADAIRAGAERGFCAESDLRDAKGSVGEGQPAIESYRQLGRLKDRFDSRARSRRGICARAFRLTQDLMPGLPAKDLKAVFAGVRKESVLPKLGDLACTKRIPLAKDRWIISQEFTDKTDSIDLIDERLKKKEPIGITYDVGLIDESADAPHASTLIGRRVNPDTGECEYQIRNSWGPKWHGDGTMWVSKPALRKFAKQMQFID